MRRLGRYILSEELGRGGMGVVYAAFDPVISREVAIKTIEFGRLANSDEVAAVRDCLLTEARSAGKLHHPAIVSIHDMGEDAGNAYIVMELVNGIDLRKRMRTERLPIELICQILTEAAEAIDFAHAKGVIHRDIKPANILIDGTGAVKLTDFGIAKAGVVDSDGDTIRVIGTPSYMSPEQMRPGTIGAKSDQYSLAVVAYELLTGAAPFPGTSTDSIFEKIRRQARPSAQAVNRALPIAVDIVLARAMALLPQDRYASCGAFIGELRRCFLSPDQSPATKPRAGHRRAWIIATCLILVLALTGAIAWFRYAPNPLIRSSVPNTQRSLATTDPKRSIPSDAGRKSPKVILVPAPIDPAPKPLDSKSFVAKGKQLYLSGKDAATRSEAAQDFLTAARMGNVEGMTLVGTMYSQGDGLTKDYVSAFHWFSRAAEAGDRRGMVNLARLYALGHGVAQDDAEVARWYTKAANAGDSDALYRLGLLYEHGKGVPLDRQKAWHLFEKSAALDNGEARNKLKEGAVSQPGNQIPEPLVLKGIEPTVIIPGYSKPYRLIGSGFSLRCFVDVTGATFVGRRGVPNTLAEAAADGSWAKTYIHFDPQTGLRETEITIHDGLAQSVLHVRVAK